MSNNKLPNELRYLLKDDSKQSLEEVWSLADEQSDYQHKLFNFTALKSYFSGHKVVLAKVFIAFFLSVVVLSLGIGGKSDSPTDTPATLGQSVSQDTPELPKETAEFDLLYPGGDSSEYETVRVSPDGAAPAFTFLDRMEENGDVFRVTQQEIPETGFVLTEVAESFQATNVIQIDDNKVYHGFNEKAGVQSLLFEKGNLFVSIRSPRLFPDELWANYIISLQ